MRAECENTGKPFQLTMDEEIPPMVDQIRFFAGAARHLQGLAASEYMAGHTSFIRREPIGVCGAVTPWNYPMMMAVWKFAPALAAGNTLVLKPSDTTPVTSLLMAEIMAEHLPPGVFNVVCGDRGTGRALVENEIPAMVSVTGSVRAGMEVAAAAASSLKRVHLELGGKAPVIVFDDADAGAAAEGIAGAGYFNAGQDCTAATRVLAGPRVHQDLLAALVEQAEGTTVGGTDNADADYGPLNNATQLERVRGFLERTPSHASVVTGGAQVGERGYCFAPTVVAGLRQDDEMVQSEVFGPVITVQEFSRRGRGARVGERRAVRAGVVRMDQGPRAGHAHGAGPRLRLRVDQHAHPAGGGDAPRRVQAVGVRQGSVDVRLRGLHTRQARDEQHRGLIMIVGIPTEVKTDEYRVALTPAGVRELTSAGHTVLVQKGAGDGSSLPDADFVRTGARIVDDVDERVGCLRPGVQGQGARGAGVPPAVAAPRTDVVHLPPPGRVA